MTDPLFEPYWSLALLAGTLVYVVMLERIRHGLLSLPKQSASRRTTRQSKVSVIIPCRNEAEHIGNALKDLAEQDYPGELIQIIVIDDRSTDGTGTIAEHFKDSFVELNVIKNDVNPGDISPKKHALSLGMQKADGEVLITTDGDCRFQPGWISSLVEGLADDVGLVTGLTIFDRGRSEPLWQRLQQLDYLSHSFFAAGAIGSGMAFNCNGSNLAYRRETFREMGGFQQIKHVVTGDDTLLLQKIKQSGRWRMRFTTHPQSLVRSWPEETPRQVFNQRLRWGSGGMSYSPKALAFALSVFTFMVLLFLSPIFWLMNFVSITWLLAFALKVLQEVRVMAAGWRIFNLPSEWKNFTLLQLVHIPAILTFSIGGHLFGFQWKGQKLKRSQETANVQLKTEIP